MMSKKANHKTNKFKYTAENLLPNLTKIQAEWDLKKLFYSSEKSKALMLDFEESEKGINSFYNKYKSCDWIDDEKKILKALKDYVSLGELKGNKVMYYLFYRRELDASNSSIEKLINVFSDRFTKLENKLVFFELTLAKLPKDFQKKLLSNTDFSIFSFYLKSIFESAKHQLSEPEEKILNLKSQTSRGLWISGTEKILNKKTILWEGKEVSLNGALMEFEQLPSKKRHLMWKKIVPQLESVSEIAENELVALALDKKINDELRGFEKPYSATTKSYDSNDKTLEKLIKVIETRGYALSKRFFTLKRKVLNKDLTYIDRNENVSKLPDFDFETGVEICRDVFYDFDNSYGQFFDEMLKNGHIDVWPKKGKGGGAFCSSGVNLPTMVMLNHNKGLESVRTLAHEMGHAIHAFKSKEQPSHYQSHSILTAETASTFFESLVAERLIEQSSASERIEILNSFIGDKIGTMIMCIARFNFELEMHNTIRSQGGMTAKDMSVSLAKHFSAYTGKSIQTKAEHGLIVFSKPHYRMNFYQYSYSFGEIASSIMRNLYSANKKFSKNVDLFLSMGDSASVESIFAEIGINMSSESSFHLGLDILESDINKFEQLLKN